MNQISLLSQDTIDKIAAGEVVERPASIVKELVENAIDADANAITVEIKDGGISLIRITDNGSGISKEEVPVAFLRHATSKIRTVDDLLTSGTLGFRGEALSSIAAVCQVEMITKTAGSLTGVRYVIEGGQEKSLEEIGAPEGTTFLVRNLFYHTPARKKFLKTAATEAGYISDLMERMALSHPDISFKFINNRDTKLHTSGNCSLRDIIYGIYGRDITANIVKINTQDSPIQITGFIGKPVISRGNRNYENYFVNGRYVKSAIIARAIEDAYKPFLMNHRYPFTVLSIEIDSNQVDVNVHPTKMEVRFADQAQIYDQVYQTIKNALMGRELIPEFTLAEKKSDGTSRLNDRKVSETPAKSRPSYPEPFEKIRSKLLAESQSPYEAKYPQMERRFGTMKPVTGTITPSAAVSSIINADTSAVRPDISAENSAAPEDGKPAVLPGISAENSAAPEDGKPAVLPGVSAENSAALEDGRSVVLSAVGANEDLSAPEKYPCGTQLELFDERLLSKSSRKKHKLLGQLFDTYWLVEFNETLYIIDQHAAHEKVLYERFIKNLKEKQQTSQMISPPLIVTLTMQEETLLKRHMDQFTSLGFEIEHFGGKEYAIHAVPGNLYGIADKTLFQELLDGLSDLAEHSSAEIVSEKIASMSCKAAVKGNMKLSAAEADALIWELLSLENPYHCPHGRPTIVSMTRYELEKKFKRIV